MSSSAQIVSRALRRLRVIGAGEDPSAEDAADGLAALNAMIAGWQADGINVSSDVPLDARFEEGVVALLAVRLADDYGTAPSAGVASDAQKGMQRLEAAFLTVPRSQFDYGLTATSRQNMRLAPGPVPPWQPKADYDVDERVVSNGHVYTCTTAGTTGIYPPLTMAASITDGTVVWEFTRVLAL